MFHIHITNIFQKKNFSHSHSSLTKNATPSVFDKTGKMLYDGSTFGTDERCAGNVFSNYIVSFDKVKRQLDEIINNRSVFEIG